MSTFFEERRKALLEGVFTQPSPCHGFAHAPFDLSSWPDSRKVGFTQPPWQRMIKEPAGSLLPLRPDELSTQRAGLKIWDAAIGIPHCIMREDTPIVSGDVKAFKSSNSYWKVLCNALARTGPLGVQGSVIRPVDPYIVDFMAYPKGWEILQAAHVLTHVRWNRVPDTDVTKVCNGRLASRFLETVADVVMSLLFNLPIYVDAVPEEHIYAAAPALPGFGLRTLVTPRINEPTLVVNWDGPAALRLDSDIAVALCGAHIQPIPYGFITGSNERGPLDHWSGLPTLLAFAGWEMVDFITHAPLVHMPGRWEGYVRGNRYKVGYGVNVFDLLSSDTFTQFVELLKPQPHKQFQTIAEWMKSFAFAEEASKTHPWPCPDCFLWNTQTDGVPLPPHRRKQQYRYGAVNDNTAGEKRLEKTYKDDVKKIILCVDKAAEKRDTDDPAIENAKRSRRSRKRAYKLELRRMRMFWKILKIKRKLKMYGGLTLNEEQLLRNYINEGRRNVPDS